VTLSVVGAGLGRTGTLSLKLALEKLLGGPCYHMLEVFQNPGNIPVWHAAVREEPVDWGHLLSRYRAIVDWPGAAFWPELHRAFPDALVLLSVRDPQGWWQSADETIFPHIRTRPEGGPPFMGEWHAMVSEMIESRFDGDIRDAASSQAAFERHNQAVRRAVAPERLLEWRASDGWGPLCEALGVAIPDEPFPRANTRDDWRARAAQ
jgi:Sulfotransferase domain